MVGVAWRASERADGAIQREPAITIQDVAGDPLHLMEDKGGLGNVSGFADAAKSSAGGYTFEPTSFDRCSAEHCGHGIELPFNLRALVKQNEYLRRCMLEPTVSCITITIQRNPLLPRPDEGPLLRIRDFHHARPPLLNPAAGSCRRHGSSHPPMTHHAI